MKPSISSEKVDIDLYRRQSKRYRAARWTMLLDVFMLCLVAVIVKMEWREIQRHRYEEEWPRYQEYLQSQSTAEAIPAKNHIAIQAIVSPP